LGLFSFITNSKKSEKKEEKKVKKTFLLNFRSADRYHIKEIEINAAGKILGRIKDISKHGIGIRKVEPKELNKEKISVKIAGVEVFSSVKKETLKEIGVKFEENINVKGIIEKNVLRPKKYALLKNSSFSKEEIEENENIQKVKSVVNLMLELDDPNTSIDKFVIHIKSLRDLEARIIQKANSVLSSSKSEISDINVAITRIGFEAVKKIVYN
jgi:hypothetical protein